MIRNSMKMQLLIVLFVINSTIILVLSSDTEAEVLLPNIRTETLSPNVESEASFPNAETEALLSNTETEALSPNTETETLLSSTEIEALSPNTETETLLSNVASTVMENSSHPNIMDKNESLLSCPIFALEPEEYKLFPNDTIYIEMYNRTFNKSHFSFLNGVMFICDPLTEGIHNEHKEYVQNTSYLTLIGLSISMVSLLIHLVVFVIVPDLKNLPGCNLAALCASLFCGYLLLSIVGPAEIEQYEDLCLATAFLLHFFLLSSVLWMSIMSYDVFMSLLRATGSLRASSTHFTLKKFGLYCLCSFGVAFLFAISSLLTDILDVVPKLYKPEFKELCWFSKRTPLTIFFAGPVIALTCLNFIFFGLSAYTLHHNKMKQDPDDQKSVLKRRYLMYFRLSVIMGITWIVGIVAAAINADWLWYIFVLLNTLQGFFVFVAFTCSKKVKKYFREKIFGARRGSQQTLSPTFQSYCFYANSIEKDMDKIVENSKEKTDTIMIHL